MVCKWYIYLNILTDRRQVKKIFIDNRPLNDKRRSVIDDNRNQLTKLIDTKSDIINQLYEKNCFNSFHKDHIESGINMVDKADRLLDIARRRSVANFKKLIDVLHTHGQPSLARLLKELGGKSTKYNKQPLVLQMYIILPFYAVNIELTSCTLTKFMSQ